MPIGAGGAGSSASVVAAAASVCVGLAGYFAYGAVTKSGYWSKSSDSSSSALNKKKQGGVAEQGREHEAFPLPPAKRQKTTANQSRPASRGLFADLEELNAQFLGMNFYERMVRQAEKDIEQAQKDAFQAISKEEEQAAKVEEEDEQLQQKEEYPEEMATPVEAGELEENNQPMTESHESEQLKEEDSTSEEQEQAAVGEVEVNASVATVIAETIAIVAGVEQSQELQEQKKSSSGRSFVPRTLSEMLQEIEAQQNQEDVKAVPTGPKPKQRGGKGSNQVPGRSRRNKRKAQHHLQPQNQQRQQVNEQDVQFTVTLSSTCKQKQPQDALNKGNKTSRKVKKTYWKKVDLIQPTAQGATATISEEGTETRQTQRRASITATA